MAAGKYTTRRFAFLLAALFTNIVFYASCSTNGKDTVTAQTSSSDEGSTFCAVPRVSDFDKHLNSAEQKATLRAALESSKLMTDGQSLIGTQSPESLMQWILYALTPLSKGCKNYELGGVQRYGEKAFANFVAVAVDSMRSDPEGEPQRVGLSLRLNPNLSSTQKEFINALLNINRRIREDSDANFRTRGQDVIHGVPLTAQEELTVKEISSEGLLKVVTYDRPFKNASGDMVSGSFIQYPPGQEVFRLVASLAKFYEEAQKKDDEEYQRDAARIMRRCLAIHPFLDGNGRSCTILAIWMQSKRNLPHSVLWSGEDILLKESEFVLRYEDGIRFHKELRETLN